MNNLTKRIIVGLLGAGLLIFLIIYSQLSFLIFAVLLSIGSLHEFYKLVQHVGMKVQKVIGLSIGALITSTPWLLQQGLITPKWLLAFVPVFGIMFISELYFKKKSPFQHLGYTVLGWCYISLPIALFYHFGNPDGTYHFIYVLGFFLCLWASDTGAYTAGKLFGKTKLFERISPNKTWEGSAGGFILSLLVAFCIAHFFDEQRYLFWSLVSVLVVVTGGMGDLVESLLKRSLGVKDSGNILPGHGGLLDRFDGLFISIYFVVPLHLFF